MMSPTTPSRPTGDEIDNALDDVHDHNQDAHDVLTRALMHLVAEGDALRAELEQAHVLLKAWDAHSRDDQEWRDRARVKLKQARTREAAVRPVLDAAEAVTDGWANDAWDVDQEASDRIDVLNTALVDYRAALPVPVEAGTKAELYRPPLTRDDLDVIPHGRHVEDQRDRCGCHRECSMLPHDCERPCRWPDCLSAAESQALADEIDAEMRGGAGTPAAEEQP